MSLENILPLLEGVKQTGPGRYLALCPVHREKTPSLVLTDKNGKILIHCFGCGCGIDEFCTALGTSLDELFPDKLEANYSGKRKREYFNAGDLLRIIDHETFVICLCAGDILAGKTLLLSDIERLKMAKLRINGVMNYARS